MNETPNSLPPQGQPAPQQPDASNPPLLKTDENSPPAVQVTSGKTPAPKKFPMKKILMIVAIIVVLAAAAAGVYLNGGQFFKGEVPALTSSTLQPVYLINPYNIQAALVAGQTPSYYLSGSTSNNNTETVNSVSLPATPTGPTDPTNTVTFDVGVNTASASSGPIGVINATQMTEQTLQMTEQPVQPVLRATEQTSQLMPASHNTMTNFQPSTYSQQTNPLVPAPTAPATNFQPLLYSQQSSPLAPSTGPTTSASLPLAFNGDIAHAQGLSSAIADNGSRYFTIDSGSLPNNCTLVPHQGDVTPYVNYTCTVDASTLTAGSSQNVTFNLTATNATAVVTIQRQALPVAACDTSTLPAAFTQQISVNRGNISTENRTVDLNPVADYGNQFKVEEEVWVNGTLNTAMTTAVTNAINQNKIIGKDNTSGTDYYSLNTGDLLSALTADPSLLSILQNTSTSTLTLKFYAYCPSALTAPPGANGITGSLQMTNFQPSATHATTSAFIPKAYAATPGAVEIGDFTINFVDTQTQQVACDTSTLPAAFTQQISVNRSDISTENRTVDLNPVADYGKQFKVEEEVWVNGTLNTAMTTAVTNAINQNKIIGKDNTSGTDYYSLNTGDLLSALTADPSLLSILQNTSTSTLTLKFYAYCPSALTAPGANGITGILQQSTTQKTQLQQTMQRVQILPSATHATTSAFIPKAYAATPGAVEIGDFTINFVDTQTQQVAVCPPFPTFGDQKIPVVRGQWQSDQYPKTQYPLSGQVKYTPGYANIYSYVVNINGVSNDQLSQLLTNSNQDLIGLQSAGTTPGGVPSVNVPDISQILQLIQNDKTIFTSVDQKATIVKEINAAKTFTIEVDATCTRINRGASAFLPYANAAGAPVGSFEFDVNDPTPASSPSPAPAPVIGGGGGGGGGSAPSPAALAPPPAAPSAPQCVNDSNQTVLYTPSQVYQSDYAQANQNFPGVLTANNLCPQNQFQRVYGALTVYRINTYLFNQIQSQNASANIGFRVRRVTDLTTLKPFTDYQGMTNLSSDILTNIYTDLKFNTLLGRIDPATFYNVNKSITLAPLDTFTLPELYSMFLQQLEMVMSYRANATVSFPIIDKFLPSYLAGYKQNPKLVWAAQAWTYGKITGMCDPTGMSFGTYFQTKLDRATVAHCFATANPTTMSALFLMSPDQVVQKYGQ